MLVECIGSGRSYLAGTLAAPVQPPGGGHSVKLIRPFDALSPRIRAVMTGKSTLPMLEIDTPDSKITLLNAKIVSIVYPAGHTRPKVGGVSYEDPIFKAGTPPPPNWEKAAGLTGTTSPGKKHHHSSEIEEIELTFAKILVISKGGKKDFSDDWPSSG